MLNPAPLTPPRVPLTDPRTGQINRAWFLFLLSLQQTAEDASGADVGPSPETLLASYDAALLALTQVVGTQSDTELLSTVAEMQKQIEGLQSQPLVDIASIIAAVATASSAPVTKTADFTVADNETWIINNKSGSTCTVTLPTASAWTGRELIFKNLQDQTLVSASSDVVPIDSAAAGTAILLNVIGNWATMVSDGTNWVIMQAASNNNLLLE